MQVYLSGLVLLSLFLVGFWILNTNKIATNQPVGADSSEPLLGNLINPTALGRPSPPPAGYIRYQNNKYGFYFYHSPQAEVTEFDEGGNASTIVLENFAKIRGLQIFIVPYTEKEISEERFKMDLPSGTITNLATTTIGVIKVPAITFNSYDEHLGGTREIWFIHEGYLYEITTFRGVRDWLTPIIQSWRFI